MVISRPCTTVGIIGSKMKVVHRGAGLFVGTCGFTASRNELPYQRLCSKPFLIITTGKIAPVSLVPIQKRHSDCFLLGIGKGIPCFDDASFRVSPVCNGTPGWIQKPVSPSTNILYLYFPWPPAVYPLMTAPEL